MNDQESPFSEQFLVDQVPHIFCIRDEKGRWLAAKPYFLKLLGLDNQPYQGKTSQELSRISNSPENGLRLNAMQDEKIWQRAKPFNRIEHFQTPEKKTVDLYLSYTPVFIKNKPAYLIISGHHLPTEKKKQRFFYMLGSAFLHCPDAQFILDANFRFVQINHAFSRLTGYRHQDIVQRSWKLLHCDQNTNFFRTLKHYIAKNQGWQGEWQCQNKEQQMFYGYLRLARFYLENSAYPYYTGVLVDITETKKAQQRYRKLAHYDDLTGLPNRVMFIHELEHSLARSARQKQYNALLFIDLDYFKQVNDTIGHSGGDLLLVQTAERLQSIVRQQDMVARLSGDEFAILTDHQKNYERISYEASLIAARIKECFRQPFHLQTREFTVGTSIGIAIYPDDAKTASDLLKHADIAMYHAKSKGRNNYQFFKKDLIVNVKRHNQLRQEIRQGLEQNEFCLYFQPQYHAKTRHLIGAEVLVRWIKASGNMVPVYQFIPVAEESGLIVPLGSWILEQACVTLKKWRAANYPIPQLSVNVSAKQFAQPDFIQTVEDTLKKTGLSSQYLELEITESMLMGDVKKVIMQLKRLHDMGIRLAIDDFGTGYSSLSYLKEFPVNVLKIDQAFVRDIPENKESCDIVQAIIKMGHSLGLEIVAEGVEDAVQLAYLYDYQCDFIQGYFFSKPLSEHDMEALLLETTRQNR